MNKYLIHTTFYNHIIFISLVSVCFLSSVFAQEDSRIKKLNDSIIGNEVYQYYVSNADTVFNGKYEFNSTKKLKNKEDIVSYNYTGTYTENKKSSDWIFSYKKLKPNKSIKEKDYKINYVTSGVEYKINAQFKNGLADGFWQVIQQGFDFSKPKDTIFTAATTFKNAKMIDSVKAESSRMRVRGALSEDGLLDGDWEITHRINNREFIEVRTYSNGVFNAHYFLIDKTKYDVNYRGLDTSVQENERWVNMKIDEDYFQILDLTNFGFKEKITKIDNIKSLSQETNQFLEKALLSFGYFNDLDVWNSLQGNQGILFGEFKVRKYPFTKTEEKQVKDLVEKLDHIEELLTKFFSNSRIEIAKLSYEDLNKYEAILKQYQKAIPALKKSVEKITLPAFQYVNRNELFPYFNLDFSFSSNLKYSYQKNTITTTHSFPDVPKATSNSIQSFFDLVNESHKDITEMDKKVNLILVDLSKQEELNEDEEELVAKKAEVKSLFSNKKNQDNYTIYHERVSEKVLNYTEQVFESYVSLPVDEKKNAINSTLICFESLIAAYIELADIPRKLNRIDDVYTRTSFNPYLMVDMSERIKERIYKAFEDYLFPELANQMSSEVNCEDLPKTLIELEKLYNRMIELSDQDTSDIEKELRKERDAATIQQILFK